MTPELRSSAAHVFVESLDVPQLSAEDEHHLRRVLRLGPADVLTVSDGEGRWAAARLDARGVRLTGPPGELPPMRTVHICAAIPKGDRLEWMVQKLTEVGATRITLLDCARGVVRWDPQRARRHVERLQRVVRQAAMQSRRVWLPEVDGPLPLDAVLDGAAVADPCGAPIDTHRDAVVVGPEGGFAPGETGAAPLVSLGPLVMRVETAAIAAAVLLAAPGQGR